MAPRITKISGYSFRRAGTGVLFDVIGAEVGNDGKRRHNWPLDEKLEEIPYGPIPLTARLNSDKDEAQKAYERFEFKFWERECEEEAMAILTYLISRAEETDFAQAGIDREEVLRVDDLPGLFAIMDQLGYGSLNPKEGQKLLATFTLYIMVDFVDTQAP